MLLTHYRKSSRFQRGSNLGSCGTSRSLYYLSYSVRAILKFHPGLLYIGSEGSEIQGSDWLINKNNQHKTKNMWLFADRHFLIIQLVSLLWLYYSIPVCCCLLISGLSLASSQSRKSLFYF